MTVLPASDSTKVNEGPPPGAGPTLGTAECTQDTRLVSIVGHPTLCPLHR